MSDGKCKWVALLRGVNVGGHNKVPMAQLCALAEGLGWRDVRSYIASGNLAFRADAGDHAGALRAAMVRELSVDFAVLVLAGDEVHAALAGCPWDAPGNLVHVMFCWDDPVVDAGLLDRLLADDEALVVQGRRVWFYAPSGMARSRLLAKIDRVLGVQSTARNLNTLRKLAQMV